MTFERSTDYSAIWALLTEERVWRRMRGCDASLLRTFTVGPREGLEYVMAMHEGKPVAVFVVLNGTEIHFCMSPEVWGRSLEVAQAFLRWAWANFDTSILVGPVPRRNRLALRLAKKAGFVESNYTDDENLTYLYLQRPEVAAA